MSTISLHLHNILKKHFSDGVIRIFTQNEERIADEATLTKFNEEVNALKRQTLQEIGGVKVSE